MKLWVENISKPSSLYQENSPGENFTDVTNDALCWDAHGIGSQTQWGSALDYNRVREKLKELVVIDANADFSNWGNLSTELKTVYTKWYVAPYALRLGIHSEEDDKKGWREVVFRTEGFEVELLEGRARIYEELRLCVADYVRREVWLANDYQYNLTKAQDLFRDVFEMKEYYISGNDPEFKEFITSTGQHSSTGLNSKDYYLPQLEIDLTNIYNGYY